MGQLVLQTSLVLAGFPNPIGWTIDKVKGFAGHVATAGFEVMIAGLTAWVLDAVVWVVNGVFNFFLDATDPNVQANWFVTGHGPYATTAAIGATLLVGFLLVGIAQGVLAGDVGGMVRQMVVHLPMAVLGMVGLVTVTQLLIRIVDALSGGVLDAFSSDVKAFTHAVGSISALSGGTATAFVIFLLGLLSVLSGIVLVAELVVRSALVYIVVALAPLVFAAQVWPALRGAGRRLLELLVALIVSKLVIAVALAVAAAAMVGSASGGEVKAIRPPEVVAEDPQGSVTQAVGILLAATAAFGVAAFSPLLVLRLVPITEAALVAQGIRGGPLRAGQQAMSIASFHRASSSARLTQVAGAQPGGVGPSAAGPTGPPGRPGVGGPPGAAAAGAAAAVASRALAHGAQAGAAPARQRAPGRHVLQSGPTRPTPPDAGKPHDG
jgi:hypothetical protein